MTQFELKKVFEQVAEFAEESMPMTARHRAITAIGLGLAFLYTPKQASLEKFVLQPHMDAYATAAKSKIRTVKKRITTIKTRMIASWYGQKFQGMTTSSGELFDPTELTAAHKTLPLGTRVKLTSVSTGKSVVVRINDRGPWVKGRDFDLSEAAALALGIHNSGVAMVEATLSERDYVAMKNAELR